jgi:hypothetical protein
MRGVSLPAAPPAARRRRGGRLKACRRCTPYSPQAGSPCPCRSEAADPRVAAKTRSACRTDYAVCTAGSEQRLLDRLLGPATINTPPKSRDCRWAASKLARGRDCRASFGSDLGCASITGRSSVAQAARSSDTRLGPLFHPCRRDIACGSCSSSGRPWTGVVTAGSPSQSMSAASPERSAPTSSSAKSPPGAGVAEHAPTYPSPLSF